MLSWRDWQEVEPRVGEALLRAVNGEVAYVHPGSRVRRCGLSFYPGFDLYQIRLKERLEDRSLYAIFDPETCDARILDGSSSVLHQINEEAPLALEAAGPEETGSRVIEYLRLFCDSVMGEASDQELPSPFSLVDFPAEIPWLGPAPEGLEDEGIEPPRYLGWEEGRHRCQAAILYGDALFRANFEVASGGEVEMLDDELIREGLSVRPQVRREGEILLWEDVAAAGELSGDEFAERLRAGRRMAGVRVTGTVDLRGCEIAEALRVEGVWFQGSVLLDSARFEQSVTLRDCIVTGALSAENARVDGSVTLSGTKVEGKDPRMRTIPDVRLDGMRVEGSLSLSRLRADVIQARWMRVEGELDLSLCEVRWWFSLQGTRVSAIWSQNHDDQASYLKVGDDFYLDQIECSRGVSLEGVEIGGDFCVRQAVLSSLHLDPGRIRPPAEDGEGGEVARSAFAGQATDLVTVPAHIGGALLVGSTRLEGDFRAPGVVIRGHLPGAAPAWRREEVEHAHFWDCEIGGKVRLDGLALLPLPHPQPAGEVSSTRIAGNLKLQGCSIGLDLKLRDLEASGWIRLEDCVVKGDVLLSSRSDAGTAGSYRTRCATLDLRGIRATGSLDLTGLELRPAADSSPGLHDVLARRAKVGGVLRLFHAEQHARDRELGYPIIPGAFDLSDAEVDVLELSGLSFEGSPSGGSSASASPGSGRGASSAAARDSGIVLRGAKIRQWTLHHPPLPCRLDLRNLEVAWWDFAGTGRDPASSRGGGRATQEDGDQQVVRHLLREDEYKFRSTFKSIEHDLLVQGSTEHAERVRRWMWNAARGGREMWGSSPRRPRPRLGKRLWYWSLEKFGYGCTRLLILLFVCSLALSTWIFSSPRNVSPSFAAREVDQGLSPYQVPRDWDLIDAVWMAGRYHIPMISLPALQDWRASPHRLVVPGTGYELRWWTAEDWAQLVVGINWVMWPLFLLSITGFLRHAQLTSS